MRCSRKHLIRCRTAVRTVISEQQKPQKCTSVCPSHHLIIIHFLKQMLSRCLLIDLYESLQEVILPAVAVKFAVCR